MNTRSLLPLFVLTAALSAQNPTATTSGPTPVPKAPRPANVDFDHKTGVNPLVGKAPAAPAAAITPRTAAAVAASLQDPDLVLVDHPEPRGPIYCRGRNYKACFNDRDWAFVAQPPDGIAASPIRFALRACSVGGRPLPVTGAPTRRLEERRVAYRYDGLTESVDLRGDAVEQSFRFDELPTREAITVRIAVSGDREIRDLGDGVLLAGNAGDVSYSEAIALDATGRRINAPTTVEGNTIVITVPRSFVESATLPLVIDPIVASTTVVSGQVIYSNPDIAWDAGTESFAVIYERFFSINDIDVHLQRFDSRMAPVGALTVVDLTLDVWQRPRIANCRLYGRHLVVAEVSADASPPVWIAGRIVDGHGTLVTSQFDIAKAGVSGHAVGDKTNPDVGGDPSGAPPTYFTVVWERNYSATDRDIHMKQVTFNGTLRSPSPTHIDNSGQDDTRPAISNSNGPPPAGEQRHVVCWERDGGQTGQDLRAALLTWDGQFVQVGGSNTFLVNDNSASQIRPSVSTPTDGSLDGERYVMIAFEQPSFRSGDIMGQVVTIDGALARTQVDLTTIELNNAARAYYPQRRPRVDSDGVRFTLAYDDETPTGDLNSWLTMFGWDPPSRGLSVHDTALAAGSIEPEFGPAIASAYASAEPGTREIGYGVALEVGVGTEAIAARTYEGFGSGGVARRVIGCGQISANVIGRPVIGNTVEFEVANPGLAGFVIGFPTPAATVPGCSGCRIGVNGSAVLVNPLPLSIPPDIDFVGLALSAQGFRFVGGTCYGSIAVSDALDVVIQ
ncbi:MAG: hypothetical protein NXI31_19540 [bacterium]|nr:hypothetical protein [bacterium]